MVNPNKNNLKATHNFGPVGIAECSNFYEMSYELSKRRATQGVFLQMKVHTTSEEGVHCTQISRVENAERQARIFSVVIT